MNNEILQKRAELLAQTEAKAETNEMTSSLLVFELAKEFYAVEVKYVKEVYRLKNLAKIPNAPRFIFGLTNVRRRIITIIDLQELFSLEKKDSENRKVILLNFEGSELALLADRIEEIQVVPTDKIEQPLGTWSGVRQEFTKGIIDHRILLLDALKMLKSPSLIVNQEKGAASG